MIIKEMNEYEFVDLMQQARADSFSREGCRVLHDYLENLSEEIDENIEFDPVAFCCEWSEYDSFEECKKDYGVEDMEELESNTTVLPFPQPSQSFIIKDY